MPHNESFVNHHRKVVYNFFDEKVIPFIKQNGDEITDELCDEVEKFCEEKMKFSGHSNWTAKKYDDTLRLSSWLKGIGMLYFMTYTPEGKNKYFGDRYHGDRN